MTAQGDEQDRADLAATQQGDQAAFQRLFVRHGGKVYGLALRTLRREDAAEDVVQETFMQLHRKAGTFRGEARVSTWLSAIALNACRMRLRQRKRTTLSLDQAAELASAEAPAEIGLTEALETLDAPARELLLLAAQGHSYDALGALLTLSADQVRGRLYRARKQLMAQMQKMGLDHV